MPRSLPQDQSHFGDCRPEQERAACATLARLLPSLHCRFLFPQAAGPSMGVPGLQTWLRRRYPEAFVPLPEGMAFDHVYIDMSSTLHQVIRRGAPRWSACVVPPWAAAAAAAVVPKLC